MSFTKFFENISPLADWFPSDSEKISRKICEKYNDYCDCNPCRIAAHSRASKRIAREFRHHRAESFRRHPHVNICIHHENATQVDCCNSGGTFNLCRAMDILGPLSTCIDFNFSMISYHMPSKGWDDITYPCLNLSGSTVEVWEFMGNVIPQFIVDELTYLFRN